MVRPVEINAARDNLSLREVIEEGYALLIHCGNCQRKQPVDLLKLVHRFGPDCSIGFVWARSRCALCKQSAARALLQRLPPKRTGPGWIDRWR